MKLSYFNFKPFCNQMLLTNDLGKYVFVSQEDFKRIIGKAIDEESELYEKLKRKNLFMMLLILSIR